MKIAQVVCRFKPYKGGISNMAYDHALGLANLGHKVTVFTPNYNQKDSEFNIDKFSIKRLMPWGKFGNGAFLPQLFWQLRKFDVIHLHYPFFGGAEVVWLVKKLKSKKLKVIITYHHDIVGGKFLKPFFKFHTRFIMPRIIKSADKVIITSQDYAQTSNIKLILEDYQDKFEVIPPAVDLNRFFPQDKDKELLYKYGINKNFDRVIVFVGALDKAHYFKGIQFLINSFSVLDYSGCNEKCGYRIKLIIVGGGELKEKYEKQVAESGLSEKIKFSGRVSDKDLPKYYNLADVVVLPSIDRSEAFGISLIEAMACAKPVVAANLPGVRSVFDNKKSGYVIEVKHEGDLANRINKLFEEDELRQQMGLAARQKTETYYSHDKLTRKLESIYDQVIK